MTHPWRRPRSAARAVGFAAAVALVPAAGAAAAGEARTVSEPYRLSPHVAPGEAFQGVRLLGSVALRPVSLEGLTLGGLSGLAWDQDESRLYALSDRGALFHLRPRLAGGRLEAVELLAAYRLRDHRGRALRGPAADAEALVLRGSDNGRAGDSVLGVSFERQPRILEFSAEGRHLADVALPPALRERRRYADPNQALEALTWRPETGFVTGPERPLAGAAQGEVDLLGTAGGHWRYRLLDAVPNASLVDLEALPDGRILTLERGHGLMYTPIVVALRETRLDPQRSGTLLGVETLAVLDSSRGWSIDNFEGLAHHRDGRLFMVSDDNFNALQRTLLVYLELLPAARRPPVDNSQDFELRHKTSN